MSSRRTSRSRRSPTTRSCLSTRRASRRRTRPKTTTKIPGGFSIPPGPPREREPGRPAFVAIGLGSNLGDRLATLRRCVVDLGCLGTVTGTSSIYETAAVVALDAPAQPDYLNAVVTLRTTYAPLELLLALKELERRAGRVPAPRWSPRALDLDILLYGNRRIATPQLVVPHPRLAERRFVLAPLAEMAPSRVVPGLARTVARLLREAPPARVRRLSARLT